MAQGSPIGSGHQLHLVIVGALGCPCRAARRCRPALQQPHSLACVAQSAGSLHRLSGLIALLRPVTCSLEFGLPKTLFFALSLLLDLALEEGSGML